MSEIVNGSRPFEAFDASSLSMLDRSTSFPFRSPVQRASQLGKFSTAC